MKLSDSYKIIILMGLAALSYAIIHHKMKVNQFQKESERIQEMRELTKYIRDEINMNCHFNNKLCK